MSSSTQLYLLISVKTRVPKTETNIANVSVVNLVKYISDNANPDFFSKCSPSSLLMRRYNSYNMANQIYPTITGQSIILGSVLPRAFAVRGQDFEVKEGGRKLLLLCPLPGNQITI